MNFQIEPDPAYPLGGHAFLILPEGASTGSGRLTLRRLYDDRYLGSEGWQSARTTLGPFEISHRGSSAVVPLGPQVVAYLAEFDALEIAFQDGDKGSAVWPDNVLLPPGLAAAGGLRRGERSDPDPDVSISGAAARKPAAESPPEPPAEPEPPEEAPPPATAETASRKPRSFLIAAGAAALAAILVVAAVVVLDDEPDPTGKSVEEDKSAACSAAAFDADRDAAPASQIERVRRCAGSGGASAEVRLAAIERLLGRSAEALVVMGRWYDPAHREEDSSPFQTPAIETAARYYFEANQAGATKAADLLHSVCARLDPNDLMQDNARQLYCEQR